jgi:cytochrome c-type biogenesis protein CcmF
VALLHGLLIQRVTGSLRRTNFFLAVTSYALVLYASFLTRSGVLADFSVHSFVNLGLNGFLLSFLFLVMIVGYGALFLRLRDIPPAPKPLGNFSRESMMWLGQLVLMLMCALIAVGMSAPLLTKLWGPASNVQTSYYNLVNAPLAIALGLLLGMAPLLRWREHDGAAFVKAAMPSVLAAVGIVGIAVALGVRQPMPALVIFAAGFALASNLIVTARGFRAGWKHGVAFLGHAGVSTLLIGVVASSGYGTSTQVQLPIGQERSALGWSIKYEGVKPDGEGRDHMLLAIHAPGRSFEARPIFYWSEFNQGYMKKPHIERFLTHDLYISPLERVTEDRAAGALWLAKGEVKEVGKVKYRFEDFDVQGMGGPNLTIAARVVAEIGGRSVPVRPVLEVSTEKGLQRSVPAYMPGGGSVEIVSVDAAQGRVGLGVPGMVKPQQDEILAIEVSTKPLINLVWLGAVLMVASAFMSVLRRALDLRRAPAA